MKEDSSSWLSASCLKLASALILPPLKQLLRHVFACDSSCLHRVSRSRISSYILLRLWIFGTRFSFHLFLQRLKSSQMTLSPSHFLRINLQHKGNGAYSCE